jgi:hypothetical protein
MDMEKKETKYLTMLTIDGCSHVIVRTGVVRIIPGEGPSHRLQEEGEDRRPY